MPYTRFLVASASPLKCAAVQSALPEGARALALKDSTRLVTSVKQPLGVDQARECARERYYSVLEAADGLGAETLVVAVENYVERGSAPTTMFDRCYVIVGNGFREVRALGNAAVVPKELVPERDFDQSITVGRRIADALDCDAADWFEATGNPFSRTEQICEAVREAIVLFVKGDAMRGKFRVTPDFPKDGVSFVDMFSPMIAPRTTYEVVAELVTAIRGTLDPRDTDLVVVGLESRGLALGLAVATMLQVRFVPLRKPGKLPGAVVRADYTKEYGTDAFEVSAAALEVVRTVDHVVVIDDLLATGGSMAAACSLLEPALPLVVTLFDVPALRAQWQRALAHVDVIVVYGESVGTDGEGVAEYFAAAAAE